MIVQGSLNVFLIGCLGGVFNELLHWWNLRDKPELPEYVRSPKYWIITLLMVLVGGAVAWLYFGQEANSLIALHVGISAPLIVQKLAASVPEPSGSRGTYASIRSFFKW